jgi:hypothetical protein
MVNSISVRISNFNYITLLDSAIFNDLKIIIIL